MSALKIFLYITIPVCIAFIAFVIHTSISANTFGRIYNQRPGPCKTFKMNGSEDIILIPSINHAIVSSGLHIFLKDKSRHGVLYSLNMNDPSPVPVALKFEDDYISSNPDFNPHGINYWIDKSTGEIYLYVVTHWDNNIDSVESFIYNPDTLSVKPFKSFRDDDLFWNLNSIVAVSREQFFVTRFRYFRNHFLYTLEQLSRVPLSSLIYYDGTKGRVAVSGLTSCNGITKSNNDKYIYVGNSLAEEIIAYTRSEDNSLTAVDSTYVPLYVDNLKVDYDTGHIWVGVFPKCLDFAKHAKNLSFPMASQTLHIAINENSDKPLQGAKMEQVFQSDSHGALSTALHTKGNLLLGSVYGNMHICQVNYLMYE